MNIKLQLFICKNRRVQFNYALWFVKKTKTAAQHSNGKKNHKPPQFPIDKKTQLH